MYHMLPTLPKSVSDSIGGTNLHHKFCMCLALNSAGVRPCAYEATHQWT